MKNEVSTYYVQFESMVVLYWRSCYANSYNCRNDYLHQYPG